LTRQARKAAERALAANAKPIRKLLIATGRDRARHLPDIVQIESTNLCNAKCVFCPRDEMHRRQGVMDFDLFAKIVDECAALGITHVRVTTTASRSSTRNWSRRSVTRRRRASRKSG
jgi:2-iminoacetate synthase ThiH